MGTEQGTASGESHLPQRLTATPSLPEDVLAVQDRIAAQSVRIPLPELVTELNAQLGSTLVAYISNVRSRQVPYLWAAGRVEPRDETRRRLIAAYRIWLTVTQHDDPATARAWFIGMNPRLDDETPATAIRDGKLREVFWAAKAFAEDCGGD